LQSHSLATAVSAGFKIMAFNSHATISTEGSFMLFPHDVPFMLKISYQTLPGLFHSEISHAINHDKNKSIQLINTKHKYDEHI
jgi:hypothetical protein